VGQEKRGEAQDAEPGRGVISVEHGRPKVYPGTPHAFFDDTSKATYREEAAKDAWERVLRLLNRTPG
jgi:dienelactone hydrolase